MKLNYKVVGEGEPIIILHGLFGMLDNWYSFAKKISSNYKVYTIDQRNHGRSPHTDIFNYTVLAEDLDQFMIDHEINQAHIIGHSMGGKTTMQFANDFPDRCLSIHIVDIAPRKNPAVHLEIFDAILSLDLSVLKSRSDADELLLQTIPDNSVRQFLLKNLGRTKEGYYWKANFKSLYNNYENILDDVRIDASIDIPSQFIRGTKSNYVHEDDMLTIIELFTNTLIHDINSGHWVHAEKPLELLAIINEFLNKI